MRGSPRVSIGVSCALLLPVVLGIVIYLSGALGQLEIAGVALRFDVRGKRPPPPSVAVVVIDQSAMKDLQTKWGSKPYPRQIWANLLSRLRAAKAGPVALDIIFRDPTNPGDDRDFLEALKAHGRTVVAFEGLEIPGEVPYALGWLPGGRDRFTKLSTYPGWVNYGGDGSSAGIVPSMLAGTGGYPTLGLATARLAGRVSPPEPNRNGELMLNFYGPPGTIDRVDIRDLLDNRIPASEFSPDVAGRAIVVGFEDPVGDSSQGSGDRPRPTTAPGSDLMSGAEIHATTAANALDDSFLRELSVPASLLLIVGMGLTLPATALLPRRPLLSLLAGVGLPILYILSVLIAFNQNLIVPVVAPTAAFVASIVAWLYLRHRRTSRDLSDLRRRFADFEPDLVGGVLAGTHVSGELDAEMIVPGYRLEAVLGRGAMGVVYRAVEVPGGKVAAVKVIRPDLADDSHFRERFKRETRIAGALEHPNVLPVLRSGDEEGLLFLATMFVDGPDLAERVRRDGALSDQQAAEVIAGIASALDRAHQLGLVHRDVKPANILLSDGHHPYLTDFGIASMTGEMTLTEAGGMIGTIGFAAPEQLTGGAVGPPADIYALAAVAFAVLSDGKGPPTASEAVDYEGWPKQLTSRPAVLRVLSKAMAADPSARYGSAIAFSVELREALQEG